MDSQARQRRRDEDALEISFPGADEWGAVGPRRREERRCRWNGEYRGAREDGESCVCGRVWDECRGLVGFDGGGRVFVARGAEFN